MNNPSITSSLLFVHELSAEQLKQLQVDAAARLSQQVYFHDLLINGTPGPEMAVIPPGVFEMGSSGKEFGHRPEESPQHYRQLKQSYAICRFAITADQFSVYERHTGWQWRSDLLHAHGQFPVININSVQACDYAAWLSEQTGNTYRLPTEVEWEYAARSGAKTAFNLGDSVTCRQVHFNSAFPMQKNSMGTFGWLFPRCMPLPKALMVGSLPGNLWGLHEMHGNVWELTASRWTDSHINHSDQINHDPARLSEWLVTKGGSWFDAAVKARSAARMPRMREELDVNLGFRLVRELDNC